jgi:perosamine synthetase
MSDRIPVAGPWITQKEIDYVTDAVTNAWYDKANLYHGKFEQTFANYVGRKYAISLPSCTSGLHLALLALGVGIGDEVIVPDVTWIATSAPISYVGATPVFADIDPHSWCIDANSFASCITPQTKAVILVDLYGNMPDMTAIYRIAQANNIAIIEDAAEAIGSEYQGAKAGSFGIISTFSFHGSKTLTTGEGGMLVTDRDNIYERCLFLRDHGRDPQSKMFWNTEVGYKYKMSSMQAALGLAQLERIEELIDRKRQIFSWYQQALTGFAGVTLNYEAAEIKNTYWMVTAILDQKFGLTKEQMIYALKDYQIDARPFFYPLSVLPAYALISDKYRQANHVSYQVSPWGINLPSALNLTQTDVNRSVDALVKILTQQL